MDARMPMMNTWQDTSTECTLVPPARARIHVAYKVSSPVPPAKSASTQLCNKRACLNEHVPARPPASTLHEHAWTHQHDSDAHATFVCPQALIHVAPSSYILAVPLRVPPSALGRARLSQPHLPFASVTASTLAFPSQCPSHLMPSVQAEPSSTVHLRPDNYGPDGPDDSGPCPCPFDLSTCPCIMRSDHPGCAPCVPASGSRTSVPSVQAAPFQASPSIHITPVQLIVTSRSLPMLSSGRPLRLLVVPVAPGHSSTRPLILPCRAVPCVSCRWATLIDAPEIRPAPCVHPRCHSCTPWLLITLFTHAMAPPTRT